MVSRSDEMLRCSHVNNLFDFSYLYSVHEVENVFASAPSGRGVNCSLSKWQVAFGFFLHHFKRLRKDSKYLVNATFDTERSSTIHFYSSLQELLQLLKFPFSSTPESNE